MAQKKSDSDTKSEWVDPDDAPELTEEWFRKADVYHGEKLIRRGERSADEGQAKPPVPGTPEK